MIGATLAHLEVTAKLGVGGMGNVSNRSWCTRPASPPSGRIRTACVFQ
jgi:hypothetical protein